MVRRNPYKKKEEDRKRRGSTRVPARKEKKGKKKRETYADSMPGVVFLCSKQSI